jgi:hypothetical protein
MTADIIELRSAVTRDAARRKAAKAPVRAAKVARPEKNMHNLLFRSREAILESDEADLIADVRFDLHKAQVKLQRMRTARQSLEERTTAELALSVEADTKLAAAIVAALVSGAPRRRGVQPTQTPEQKRAATIAKNEASRIEARKRVERIAGEFEIEPDILLRRAMRGDTYGIYRLCEEYPLLNVEWLIAGTGKPYKLKP